MALDTVPVTITFRRAGTVPPLFLAGSFSDPPWEPREMDYTADEHGERTFKAEIYAKGGSTIQYKFRAGTGDWWVLDEDAPSGTEATPVLRKQHDVLRCGGPATDDMGNRNNTMEVALPERSVRPLERQMASLADSPLGSSLVLQAR